MKFRLLFLALILSAPCFAQNIKDVNPPPEIIKQLGNTSNTYSYILTTANVGTGLLSDTTSNTTVLTLQTVNYAFLGQGVKINGIKYPATSADTVYPAHLDGQGMMSFFAKVYKVTGTDTMVITPVESIDGSGVWTPIAGLAAATVTPTSLTVPVESDWTVNSNGQPILKSARHYGLQYKGNASSTMTVLGWIRDWSPIK